MRFKASILLLASLLSLIALTRPAFAYFDPTSGSMLVQGLVALASGGVVAVASFANRIRQKLRLIRDKLRPSDSE